MTELPRNAVLLKESRSSKCALSPAESLRFKAIIQSTVDALKIAQTLSKGNLHSSSAKYFSLQPKAEDDDNLFDYNEEHKMSKEKKQNYLRDTRMIEEYFVEIVNLFNKTAEELEHQQSWNTLRSFIERKLSSKKEIEDSMQQICDIIERKKKIENEILIERKDFKKQESKMMQAIDVLEKRHNNLTRETTENLRLETHLCKAQRSSLHMLHTRKLDSEGKHKKSLSKELKNEHLIHKMCSDYLSEHNRIIAKSIENSTKKQIDDMQNADDMISELQISLELLRNQHDEIDKEVTEYETNKKEKMDRECLVKEQQKRLEMEKTKQITSHVFNKIIQKFEKKKPIKKGKAAKKTKKKAKKKKKKQGN